MSDALRPFQEEVVNHLSPRKRGGLAIDMGLGKTAIVSMIGARERLQRWLVICSDNAFSVWKNEAPRWIKAAWPEAHVHINFIEGHPWNRALQWDRRSEYHSITGKDDVQIYVVTPDTFIRDWGTVVKIPGKKKKVVRFVPRPQFLIPQIVIFDETKRIRNPESVSFQILSRFLRYYHVEYFFPMTGTPGHTPKDFWTMLHCIDPQKFGSYWQFVTRFHETVDGMWGKEILGPKNLDQWHQVLSNYFSVIKETDEGIAKQRPPITRQLLPIAMDPDQEELYNALVKELMFLVESDDHLIIVPNEFALATRLRQTLVCPRLLSPSLGIGSAIKDFADTADTEAHYVIFTPFTQAIPHFTEYLSSKGFNCVSLQGGMGTPERDNAISVYRQKPSVCICSILYAQAFSLEPATRCFFIGYDWDPDNNRQAEKRLHRLTTQSPISCYYYTFRSTFDEHLADIVNIKQQHVNLTIPANLRKFLKGEEIL